MDVADHLLTLADVLGEQGHEVLVQHAGSVELHGRDLKALLVDLTGVQAVLGAADVGDVADGADDGHHLPVAEDGRDDGHIEEMASADPRVVGDQDVAGLERLHREPGQDRLDRERQRQVEDRHRAGRVSERVAARVEDLAGEVLGLADDQRERRPPDGEPALLDEVDESAPHDLEPDRVTFDPGHRMLERLGGRAERLLRGVLTDGEPQVEAVVDGESVSRRHHRRRLALFHDHGPLERVARPQCVAIVNRRLPPAS